MKDLITESALKQKIQSLRSFRGKILPAWARRAQEHPELHTKKNESVQSASGEYKGKEILFPTIRMRGPGLEKLNVRGAFKEALKKKDYITFESPKKATQYSREFSNELGRKK